jgi:drug/metabolite transporter (DMT)-like permease
VREIVPCLSAQKTRNPLLLATLLGSYLGIWCMMTGFLNARTVGVAATLTATSPIFVLPVVKILYDERISPRAIVGSLVAVGGVAVLVL